jgi:hypothetical protein
MEQKLIEVKRYVENTSQEAIIDEFERLVYFFRTNQTKALDNELHFIGVNVDEFDMEYYYPEKVA